MYNSKMHNNKHEQTQSQPIPLTQCLKKMFSYTLIGAFFGFMVCVNMLFNCKRMSGKILT